MAGVKKRPTESAAPALDSYEFETSGYVIVKKGIRRDSSTGRLVHREDISRAPVARKAD